MIYIYYESNIEYMIEESKQSHLDKIYYESYNNKFSDSIHFSEFMSTKKSIYSQSSKYYGESLSCENTRLLSKQLKGQKTNETHGLIQWTCKKCAGCIKYKQMAREHKIEDKFVDNPEIDVDDLYLLTIELEGLKPKQITNKLKYLIKKFQLDIDLLLYSKEEYRVFYLVRGYLEISYRTEGWTAMVVNTLNNAIDFFGPLATKFLGPFYSNKRLPNITTVGEGKSRCMCGKPEDDHQLVLTSADEICSTMTSIPEYETGFDKFKEMYLPGENIAANIYKNQEEKLN